MFTLYSFIETLKQKKIFFSLHSFREDSIMIRADVPGERWEIEFMKDGKIEAEIFKSSGEICGKESLKDFLDRFAD